jgi:hypothetical protein
MVRQMEEKNVELYTLHKSIEKYQAEITKLSQLKPQESPELIELRLAATEFAEYERKSKDLIFSKEQQISDLISYKKKCRFILADHFSAGRIT